MAPPIISYTSLVAAGLRCTLANSAYNARELAFQFTDSGAKLILTSEEGIAVVRETLKSLGLTDSEVNKRIIVMTSGLEWAGGPSVHVATAAQGLPTVADLLKLGSLKEEEKFDGHHAKETVYLCYSSGSSRSFMNHDISTVLIGPSIRYHRKAKRGRGMNFVATIHNSTSSNMIPQPRRPTAT